MTTPAVSPKLSRAAVLERAQDRIVAYVLRSPGLYDHVEGLDFTSPHYKLLLEGFMRFNAEYPGLEFDGRVARRFIGQADDKGVQHDRATVLLMLIGSGMVEIDRNDSGLAIAIDDYRNLAAIEQIDEISRELQEAGELDVVSVLLQRSKEVGPRAAMDEYIDQHNGPLPHLGRRTAQQRETLLNASMTDSGYADRLNSLHGDDCRWCEPLRSWLVWDGRRWRRDDMLRVMRLAEGVAKQTSELVLEQSRWRRDEKERGDQVKRAVSRESTMSIRNSLELFKTRVAVAPTVFDRERWFLNLPNGTMDLRTGEVHAHTRRDMITKVGGIEYDPEATCPKFEAFIEEIFAGDRDLIRHVQKLVGMTLSGEVRDHVFTILHGSGSNGKTQFIKIMTALLGDYACKVQPEALTPSRKGDAGAASSHLARLAGHRFACCDETEEGAQLAESLVKRITGGDRVVARSLYREETEFDPQLSLWLDTNHKPAIARGGHAIWRRIQLIPFSVTIPEDRQVKGLAEMLVAEEGPGIMRWAVEGCRLWQDEGLTPVPAAVHAATEAYRTEEDKIGRFVADQCEIDASRSVQAATIHAAYQTWCHDQGLQPEGQPRFCRRLQEEYRVEQRRTKYGQRLLGIDLRVEQSGWDGGPE